MKATIKTSFEGDDVWHLQLQISVFPAKQYELQSVFLDLLRETLVADAVVILDVINIAELTIDS